ncbi:tetratricopeptide repeat-containing sulfotransferase family protein [Reinekea thalattae]|uniref:Tetratricopeptide repeat protein n=1 Tax=Reinekea thalattae TaxID=2593301 RepID=A0A5C8Z9Y4_9GAMM|nr:sulfotransferase [Reinekea thalattae]TXR54204.1 tetratricopeptide repeat protein [Reinekea thalattae]
MLHGEYAVRYDPEKAVTHFYYGTAFLGEKEFEQAAELFKKSIELDPNMVQAYINLGSAYGNLDRHDLARENYLNAIRLDPNRFKAHLNLATLELTEGNIEEATKQFESIITLNPDNLSAHRNLSRLKKYTDGDPHIEILEKINPNIHRYSIEDQVDYWFTLGKVYQDLKNYKLAFEAFDIANQLHRKTFKTDSGDFLEFFELLKGQYSESISHRNLDITHDDTPIFIVGMPRSGTTLTEQILDSHSQISGAGELTDLQDTILELQKTGESPDLNWLMNATDAQLTTIQQRYLERLKNRYPKAKKIVNKLPGNALYVGLIYQLFPHAKVIHAMRDPIDTCVSIYTLKFSEPIAYAYNLTELGTYCRQCDDIMQHWKSILPNDFIYSLQYESLVEDVETYARELINFCGLDWEDHCVEFYNNKRVVKTASQNQVNKPIYKDSVKRWKHYEPYLQPLIESYYSS